MTNPVSANLSHNQLERAGLIFKVLYTWTYFQHIYYLPSWKISPQIGLHQLNVNPSRVLSRISVTNSSFQTSYLIYQIAQLKLFQFKCLYEHWKRFLCLSKDSFQMLYLKLICGFISSKFLPHLQSIQFSVLALWFCVELWWKNSDKKRNMGTAKTNMTSFI